MLLRFSGMGYFAVALLMGSGLINSWYLLGSLSGFWETYYGQLLLLKLSLFAGMLVLAATNRFWLVPTLKSDSAVGHQGVAMNRLRRHVLGEELLGLFVILIVSALGTMDPAAE